jgi:hypothetical protein
LLLLSRLDAHQLLIACFDCADDVQEMQTRRFAMLKFLGTTSDTGNCPTAYETDTEYLIQGTIVTDPAVLEQIRQRGNGIPDYETVVAVPKALAKFLPREDG